MKGRLIIMNFLQFAVWGAYLTCMGTYLATIGHADSIGLFYSAQGIASLFMPAIVGIIADRFIQAQKTYGICHLISAAAMISLGMYGINAGSEAQMSVMYPLYFTAIAFYMPSLSLSYSVAYNALELNGMDTVKSYPPIRTFGTVGFIASMWAVDLLGFQNNANQFLVSGILGAILGFYAFSLPECKINKSNGKKSLSEVLGLDSFKLFKDSKMAVFMIFSALIGMCLQITNSFANPFITSFEKIEQFADTFGVQHANILISLSQISETLCILLIPFFLKKFGIKKVMLIAMSAWILRFAFFGLGDPGSGVWLFVLSCIVYGVAFDFFNISGSLYVNQTTDSKLRSSAQGLFMLMTNGIGATVGTLAAQAVINANVNSIPETEPMMRWEGWAQSWYMFAAYALVITIAFALIFKYKHNPEAKKD
ncbi:MAG: MFS transporter [Bacteroidales bacterium]|nr:MFS transporter [Bacteroidales bacterium]MBP5682522.1 MFS transporter [Bacteroidales bacterium]